MGKPSPIDRPPSPLKEPLMGMVRHTVVKPPPAPASLLQPLLRQRDLKKNNSAIEQYVSVHPISAREQIYPTNIFVDYSDPSGSMSCTPPVDGKSHLPLLDRMQFVLDALPAQKIAGLVTIPLFAGYAALFSLQHVIKVFFGLPDDDSVASHHFSYAITSLYFWNLIFRLGHNVLLGWLDPKQRSLVGIGSMTIAMSVLGIGVFYLENKSLWLVAVAYAFGGIAVGTFETNYSVVLAGLGNRTKIYGISGIPLGIFLVIVPGFIAVAMGLPVIVVYALIILMLIGGGAVLMYGLTYPDLEDLMSGTASPIEDGILDGSYGYSHNPPTSHWIWTVLSVGIVFTINMVFVAAFSPGVLLYLYNGPSVPMGTFTVPTGFFFAFFSSFGFVADVLSRKRIYSKKPNHHPVWYLLFTFAGIAIIVAQVPAIAPLGTFLVFFANGSIYAQSCRWLDMKIEKDVSLLANSCFFFLGDCGSVIGALSIPFIRDVLVAHVYTFMALT